MNQANRRWQNLKKIALVGTHLPRRCGIGTFTKDLADALTVEATGTDLAIVAMNDQREGYSYPDRVRFQIDQDSAGEYRQIAQQLNESGVDAVCVQHEYGIFGGADGELVIDLIARLRMPVVTTLHTILNDPTEGQRRTMARLSDHSDRLIVLARRGVRFLKQIYRVPDGKIVHIPHGIPEMPKADSENHKSGIDLADRKVILTFGLLGPGKGIEMMIDAMPEIVAEHPEVVYVVVGAAHPHALGGTGEDYHAVLARRARQRHVAEHIIFHDQFVSLEKLCEYLGASDVYVTPYLNKAQVVSGTLAYAMGTGCVVVSTPYWYAQEMLADGRGRIVPFANPKELACTITELLSDPMMRQTISQAAYQFTRSFLWSNVAQRYLNTFDALAQQPARITPFVPGAGNLVTPNQADDQAA